MWAFVDQQPIGANKGKHYTYARVAPGKHLFLLTEEGQRRAAEIAAEKYATAVDRAAQGDGDEKEEGDEDDEGEEDAGGEQAR